MPNDTESNDQHVDDEQVQAERKRREAELLTAIGDASGAVIDETVSGDET